MFLLCSAKWADLACSLRPRIEDPNVGSAKVSLVTGTERQGMHLRGRGDKEIRLTESNRPFSASRDHAAPFQDDFLVHGQNPPGKPGPQPVGKPRLEFLAKYGVCLTLDPETNLGKGDAAEKEVIRRLRIGPRLHAPVGPGLAQLGPDVGIEQPSIHNSTARTGLRTPSSPNSKRFKGD